MSAGRARWPLRPATAADAVAMAAVHRLSFAMSWDADALAVLLAAAGGYGLIAGRGGVTGFILCRTLLDEAEILTLAVHPGRRGRGCGQVLVEAAVAAARSAGCPRMLLEVAENNPAARALYAACGFRPIGRRRRYYAAAGGPPVDALVLSRGG